MNYEANICKAIDVISTEKINKAAFDKTMRGVIKSCIDENNGSYKIQIKDAIFTAYATSNIKYPIGSEVYVLVPMGDEKKDKIILWSSKSFSSQKETQKFNSSNGVGQAMLDNTSEIFNDYTNNIAGLEGSFNKYAHAEGQHNKAIGQAAHADGAYNEATSDYSSVSGFHNKTPDNANSCKIVGQYNDIEGSSNALFVVGNGTDEKHRSNALVVRMDGSVEFQDKFFTKKIQFTPNGFILDFENLTGKTYTNTFEIKETAGKITKIINKTLERTIEVTYT